ncbi:MAG: hypothetical protein U1F16_06665 [Turneriella sp.]
MKANCTPVAFTTDDRDIFARHVHYKMLVGGSSRNWSSVRTPGGFAGVVRTLRDDDRVKITCEFVVAAVCEQGIDADAAMGKIEIEALGEVVERYFVVFGMLAAREFMPLGT